jgi:hypothetical protein
MKKLGGSTPTSPDDTPRDVAWVGAIDSTDNCSSAHELD